MTDVTAIFRLLYLSRLAPPHNFSVFKPIVVSARSHNPAHGISGALVFDGERFCQLLEGPRAAVSTLIRRIEADARHTALLLLDTGSSASRRLLPSWSSGYCDADELDRFEGEAGLRGPQALDAFVGIVASADMSD